MRCAAWVRRRMSASPLTCSLPIIPGGWPAWAAPPSGRYGITPCHRLSSGGRARQRRQDRHKLGPPRQGEKARIATRLAPPQLEKAGVEAGSFPLALRRSRVLASQRIQPLDRKKEETMAQSQPSAAREQVRDIVPGLIDLSERVLFGEVWERPGLSKRDRSLITCATLIALGRERQLVGHLGRALDNGLSKKELSEVITHLAFYAGWPAAMTAAQVAKDVFDKR